MSDSKHRDNIAAAAVVSGSRSMIVLRKRKGARPKIQHMLDVASLNVVIQKLEKQIDEMRDEIMSLRAVSKPPSVKDVVAGAGVRTTQVLMSFRKFVQEAYTRERVKPLADQVLDRLAGSSKSMRGLLPAYPCLSSKEKSVLEALAVERELRAASADAKDVLESVNTGGRFESFQRGPGGRGSSDDDYDSDPGNSNAFADADADGDTVEEESAADGDTVVAASQTVQYEPGHDPIVAADITGRILATAPSGATYTAYQVNSMRIDADGQSTFSNALIRYSKLRKIDSVLQKLMTKEEYKEAGLKFPPKKFFKNKEEKFLEQRQEQLAEYLKQACVLSELVANRDFLKTLYIYEPRSLTVKAEKRLYGDALLDTADERSIEVEGDPVRQHDDPSTALTILMLEVCEKEIFPVVEIRIRKKIKVKKAVQMAMRPVRAGVARTVSSLCEKSWKSAIKYFRKARNTVDRRIESDQKEMEQLFEWLYERITPTICSSVAGDMNISFSSSPPDDSKEPDLFELTKTEMFARLIKFARQDHADRAAAFAEIPRLFRGSLSVMQNLTEALAKAKVSTGYLSHVPFTKVSTFMLETWISVMEITIEEMEVFFKAQGIVEYAVGRADVKAEDRREYLADSVAGTLRRALAPAALRIAGVSEKRSRMLRTDESFDEIPAVTKDEIIDWIETIVLDVFNFFGVFRCRLIENILSMGEHTSLNSMRDDFVNMATEVAQTYLAGAYPRAREVIMYACRLALVDAMVNDAWQAIDPLVSPADTADLVSESFTSAGFTVDTLVEVAMNRLLHRLAYSAIKATTDSIVKRIK
jgi:PX domain